MSILLIIAISIVIFGIVNHYKISYEEYYKRCEINARHPDWEPFCTINFLEKDPQWFVDNGYGDYVKGHLFSEEKL